MQCTSRLLVYSFAAVGRSGRSRAAPTSRKAGFAVMAAQTGNHCYK